MTLNSRLEPYALDHKRLAPLQKHAEALAHAMIRRMMLIFSFLNNIMVLVVTI